MKTTASIGLGLVAGLVAASCSSTTRTLSENHCANREGDDWCRNKYTDGSRPFCSRGIEQCETAIGLNSGELDGCVADRPVEDACYSPCGGRSDVTEDASCLESVSSSSGTESSSGGTTEGTSESGSSESSSTTGPVPCVGNEDCSDPAAPFCEPSSGECVTCEGTMDPDAACAELDPEEPLCVNGACVECTLENPLLCDERLLLCDGDTNTCVPCVEHAECGSGACELAVGTCFPPGAVVHVDEDGGQDFGSITDAVASVGAGEYRVIVVHEIDGADPYTESVLIDAGKRIALFAAPGELPIIQGTGGNPGLRVEGAGTILYADGLRLELAAAVGLHVNGALAWADRSRIVQNSGGGVLAESGAELTLRNCFVGDGTSAANALTINSASADVVFSSLGTGFDGFDDVFSVACNAPISVTLRNSFLVSFDNVVGELSCPGATVENTVSETAVPGPGNVGLGDIQPDWFVDIMTGDFHLNAPPVAVVTTAQWETGDPLIDIDNDPRPAIDGSPDYAGADVP